MDTDSKEAMTFLRSAGFSQREAASVLRAATKNRFNLLAYARRAIRLRSHVQAGCPLSQ